MEDLKTPYRPTTPLTVAQLRSKLLDMDQAARVVAEGCDCYADCVGISEEDGKVIIRVEHGTYSMVKPPLPFHDCPDCREKPAKNADVILLG